MASNRLPVLVGAFERTYRDDPPSPLAMLTEAARGAAGDAGAPDLLERAGVVAVVDGFSWPVPDPGREVAGQLGLTGATTWRSARGGTGPLALLQDACAAIASGGLDVALIAGAEAMTPYMRAVRGGESTGWAEQDERARPGRVVGRDADASHPAETAAGLIAPIFYYPLFEHAHRAAAGRSVRDHVDWIASWWAPYSEVAAANEHAWSRERLTAEQVATPGPGNRLVSSPYTKVMNANIQVDQAAALLVCSAAAAEAAGIPRERWVFVEAAAGAHDHWFAGERPDLHRSPALAAAGRAALGHAGVDAVDIEHVDLYSCFPSAVETASAELGIPLGGGVAAPTVTGGLAFFGGPANDYATHSVATLVRRIREAGGRGLATAVGWYLTKHHVAVLSAEPPARGFGGFDVQDEVDAQPKVDVVAGWSGEAEIEAYTATYDRDGTPTMATVAVRTPQGGRAFARTHEPDACAALTGDDEPLDRRVTLDGEAGFRLA